MDEIIITENPENWTVGEILNHRYSGHPFIVISTWDNMACLVP